MKKILIITVHNMSPIQARIGKEIKILKNEYFVDFLSVSEIVKNSTNSNRVFRGLFQNVIFRNKVLRKLNDFLDFDYYIFYDLHLLNIAYSFKKSNLEKKVIYETIDDNLSLYLHYNFKKIPYYLSFESIVIKYLRKFEINKASFLDATIVNSKGLLSIFDNKVNLLFYTSIFGSNFLSQNTENRNAFLYLGGFDENKGALETIALSKKFNVPLFVFGNVSDKIKNLIKENDHIKYFGYMNQNQMLVELKIIISTYFLFGISLINIVHNSYRIQIANKEIDYLALGIPILGNYREPTKELIELGCGIFLEEFDDNISSDEKNNMLQRIETNSNKMFSNMDYSKKLLKIINDL